MEYTVAGGAPVTFNTIFYVLDDPWGVSCQYVKIYVDYVDEFNPGTLCTQMIGLSGWY
jgi:hypothetical protein